MKKSIILPVCFLIFFSILPSPAKNKTTVLMNRVGPSVAELFVANADGTGERRLFAAPGFDYNASFSPDGKWIVFTSERAGSADIFRAHVDGSGVERLTDDPAFDDQGALSPDGKQLAFVSTRGSGSTAIWVLDLATRKARSLTTSQPPNGDFRPHWSPDGKWIVFSSDRGTGLPVRNGGWEHLQAAGVYVIGADGTGLRRLTAAGKYAGSPKWSSDGKRVVFYEMAVADTFTARTGAGAVSQIVAVDAKTGARTELTSGPGLKVAPQLLSTGGVAYLMKAGPHAGLVLTSEAGAAHSDPAIVEGSMRNPSWSPDGKLVVYQRVSFAPRAQNQALFSKDPEFELRYSDVFPAISRDGRLALTDFRASLNDTKASISVMDIDGANQKRLFVDEAGAALVPTWSPDGQWIAFGFGAFFNAREQKPARVIMVRANGAEKRDVTQGPANSGFPSWSPDGKHIVYRVWSDTERGLRIVNVDDGSVATLTTDYDNFPSWSPAGDRIAFTRANHGAFDVFSIRPDGTDLKQLTDAPGNDAHSGWSPDGQYILFSSSRFGFKDESPLYEHAPQPYGELFVMKADGSEQRPLTDNNWEDATPAWVPAAAQKK